MTEQLIPLAVVAGEPRLVLHHSPDRQAELAGEHGGTLGHTLGRNLRCRHYQHLGAGHELSDRHRDVAGAGWKIEHQEVRLAPVHIHEELFQGLVQHRSAPHDRLVVVHEETHRDAPDAVGHRWDEKIAEQDRGTIDSQHGRNREAVDVCIKDRHRRALARQGDREIDRHGRLAHSTLARRDSDDAGARRLVGKRVRVGRGPFSTVTVPTATRTGTRTGAVVTVEPGGLVARLTRRCPAEIVKPRTQVSLLGLGHVDELDRRGGAPSGGNRFRDLVGKVPRCWVPGGRHGKDNVGTVPVDLNRAKQPELADAVKQARIDYSTDGRLEGLDGMGHQPGGSPVIHVLRRSWPPAQHRGGHRYANGVSEGTRQSQGPVVTDEGFSATVAAITSAFGDSTRRQIYLFARERQGVTATEVAEHFALHPNVARHHLDKLAAGGYLDVYVDRGNAGVGRPSKRYLSGAGNTTAAVPALRDDLLLALLGRLLTIVDPVQAEQIAHEVGAEYGRSLASQMAPGDAPRSLRSAMQSVAHALTAQGFAAHGGVAGSPNSIVRDHCPFGDAAIDHPVLCAADRGLVEGLLNGLCRDGVPVQLSSRARGDEVCATVAG